MTVIDKRGIKKLPERIREVLECRVSILGSTDKVVMLVEPFPKEWFPPANVPKFGTFGSFQNE